MRLCPFLAVGLVLYLPGPIRAQPHVRLLSNDQAWKVLPKAEEGGGQDLPAWIRALAGPLPRTAAAMIDLDYAQRVEKLNSKEKRDRDLSPKSDHPPKVPTKLDDPDWTEFSYDALQEKLKGQIARPKARIAIPDATKDRPTRILWTRINYGYQPRLATAWIDGLRAFKSETDLPTVEQETMFWVVTRSLQCFY